MSFDRANPPAVVIVLALEEPVRVTVEALTEGETERLRDWIQSNPRLAELYNTAKELRAAA